MMNGTQAGAEAASAPAVSRLTRQPTFGDWVRCGDMQKTLLVADAFAADDVNATMEFVNDPEAVAAWFKALTGMTGPDIAAMPMAEGRALFKELRGLLPGFNEGKAERGTVTDTGVLVPLTKPLPGAREQTAEIFLRQPLVGDWIECGDISLQRVAVDDQPDSTRPRKLEQRLDRGAVNRWMRVLTGKPEAILHLMAYEDARVVFAHMRAMLAGVAEGN